MTISKFYKNRSKTKFISYQSFQTPYGGPRGKAVIALRDKIVEPINFDGFFYYIKNNYPECFNSIEWVRFHHFTEGNFYYSVAIINLEPNIYDRTILYDRRNIITKKTGWYPLIMGSKAIISLPKIDNKSCMVNRNKLNSLNLDKIEKIEEVKKGENSFKIYFNNGNILLDTGFNCGFSLDNETKLIFISHFHQDHSGGLFDILANNYDIPIILTLTTFNSIWYLINFLYNKSNIKEKMIGGLLKNSIIIHPTENINLNKINIHIFNSYHCPGSIGIKINDSSNNCLIYFGDICIKNGFLDYSSYIYNYILAEKDKNTIVLLDSTFIGKQYDNIPYTQTPSEVLEMIKPGKEIPNVWFISKQAETLIYLFLFFFKNTRKVFGYPKKLLLDKKLITLLQSIWYPYAQYLLKKMNSLSLDPFLNKEFLPEKTNFIESHRIYPLQPYILKQLQGNETVMGFYSEKQFKKQIEFLQPEEKNRIFSNSHFYLIGEAASFEDLRQKVYELNPLRFEKLSSADWLFHSNNDDLYNLISDMSAIENIRIILFHNIKSKLDKFFKKNNFSPNKINYFQSSFIYI